MGQRSSFWMRATTLLVGIVAIYAAFAIDCVAAAVVDRFDDGVWNADGKWDPNNITQGLNPDTIAFNEAVTSGVLTVNYANSGEGAQSTLILRKDAALGVGDYVLVDVRIVGGESTNYPQAGLGLASSPGRDAPAKGGTDRANVLYWRPRNGGVAAGHCYGANGTEIAAFQTAIAGYVPGMWLSFVIHRKETAKYDFYFARTGQPLEYKNSFTYTGSTGAGETPPTIPGLMLENGLASFSVEFDNFAVGAWPPPTPTPTPTPTPGARQVALILPANIDELPKLESTRHVVHMPRGDGDNTYHHGAEIEYWKGRIYLAWHSTLASEATYPYEARVSASTDGETWSVPVDPGQPGRDAYKEYMCQRFGVSAGDVQSVNAAPRNWHATADRLYLFSLGWIRLINGTQHWVGRVFWTENGQTWEEIAPAELDRLETEQNLLIRGTFSNRGFIRLLDGRLMAAAMEGATEGGKRLVAPITSDPTGLTGWSGGWVDTSDCADVGEPGGWESPDGALHYTARYGNRIWHAYSEDRGLNWTKLATQSNFSDCPGNKKFGRLPDESTFYVGNPVPGTRKKLVFAYSRDGWTFDRSYLVRWEEDIQPIWPTPAKYGNGYEYPTAVYHDGWLYVAYSRTRDYMEVSKVKLAMSAGAGVDDHTVALWPFDEPRTTDVNLTDAGQHMYDLHGGSTLVEGTFGLALRGGTGRICWPADRRNGPPIVPFKRLIETLGGGRWTLEFWLKQTAASATEMTLADIGPPEWLWVGLAPGANAFVVRIANKNAGGGIPAGMVAGLSAQFPVGKSFTDGSWHHVAVTRSGNAGETVTLFIDGIPRKGTWSAVNLSAAQATGALEPSFEMALLSDVEGLRPSPGMLDEVRLSDSVRYTDFFAVPRGFTRNHGPNPPAATVPTGPPLLFASGAATTPVALGGRKHVFIDEALIENSVNVQWKVNRPGKWEMTDANLLPKQPWFPVRIPHDGDFVDEGDSIRIYVKGPLLAILGVSTNGYHWTAPNLGLVPLPPEILAGANMIDWDKPLAGSTNNNFTLMYPLSEPPYQYGLVTDSGTVIKDPNPNCPPSEKYKASLWWTKRGINLWLSPDGLRWRRNETAMLAHEPDGDADTVYDDQRGGYLLYARNGGRKVMVAINNDPLKPWQPEADGAPVIGRPTDGEVYRCQATKYSWAPDVYLAFPWKYFSDWNVRLGCELFVSRDGVNWKRYAADRAVPEGWYYHYQHFPPVDGQTPKEALSLRGMILRGDELWQFIYLGFTNHGFNQNDRLLKMTQRLDGFVALTAAAQAGWARTKPLIFSGRRLELNVASPQGYVKVGILDAQGQPISGFGTAECQPITADGLRHVVMWDGNQEDVSGLAGMSVRLQFELQNAKLFAFQFTDAQDSHIPAHGWIDYR